MKNARQIVSSVLALAALLFCALFVFLGGNGKTQPQEEQYGGILRLWHIDSFEGGKGSRASFLNRAAEKYEKQNSGLYIMVTGYTVDGAEAAIAAGERPDLLSFSCGIEGTAEICRALDISFQGGVIGGDCYAYPWCGGKYYLFCLENDFFSLSADNLLLSDGGNNLPWVAAALYGIQGAVNSADSTSAYVQFLNGKYKYLLGTQRDVCRFAARGATVYRQELIEYSDLYQYIAVTTREAADIAACKGFVSSLLSEDTQSELESIGMYSLREISVQNTLSAFVGRTGLEETARQGKQALETGEIKILKTYLKSLN